MIDFKTIIGILQRKKGGSEPDNVYGRLNKDEIEEPVLVVSPSEDMYYNSLQHDEPDHMDAAFKIGETLAIARDIAYRNMGQDPTKAYENVDIDDDGPETSKKSSVLLRQEIRIVSVEQNTKCNPAQHYKSTLMNDLDGETDVDRTASLHQPVKYENLTQFDESSETFQFPARDDSQPPNAYEDLMMLIRSDAMDIRDGSNWLHGNITRDEAERRLCANGTVIDQFLIRSKGAPSTSMVMSRVGTDGKVVHHLIEQQVDHNYAVDKIAMDPPVTSLGGCVAQLAEQTDKLPRRGGRLVPLFPGSALEEV